MSKLTNEEKRRLGIELSPIEHTQKRRAPWHDYAEVGTYMLTLVAVGRAFCYKSARGNITTTSKPSPASNACN